MKNWKKVLVIAAMAMMVLSVAAFAAPEGLDRWFLADRFRK